MEEAGIGLGMTAQGVVSINKGADFTIVYFDEGAPYTCYGTAIIKGKDIPEPGLPESFKVLQKELQALAIDMSVYDVDGNEIDMKAATKFQEREERRLQDTIKAQFSDFVVEDDYSASQEDSFDDDYE